MSKIEWTEKSWNPVTGCTKVSPGCKHCYAENMAKRLQAMGVKGYENAFQTTIHPDRLSIPLKRKTPTIWFVNSMSDLFHPDVPDEFIYQVMKTISDTPRHTYQILTKRADRMLQFFGDMPSKYSDWLSLSMSGNAWLGVSVENREHGIPRIDALRETDAGTRFLSIEPLLEDLGTLDLKGIHWVIVGGESGNGARPMREEWVDNIKHQCDNAEVPFFFKQWGAWGRDGVKRSKVDNGRQYKGRFWNNMPQPYMI